jgi:integrase
MAAKTPCKRDDIKRAFLFACYLGIGLAEFRNLRWKHIQNNKLIILRVKTGEQMINDLHPSCKKLIGARGRSDELVFDLPSETTIRKHLFKWIKAAGIEKYITFYCGRHTFATQLLLNGASLKTVADCLGHASTDQTVKYLNYVDTLKTKVISSLLDISVE